MRIRSRFVPPSLFALTAIAMFLFTPSMVWAFPPPPQVLDARDAGDPDETGGTRCCAAPLGTGDLSRAAFDPVRVNPGRFSRAEDARASSLALRSADESPIEILYVLFIQFRMWR